MTETEQQTLITQAGFTRRLGISRWAFSAWRKAGLIPPPHIHKGRITRWKVSTVDQFVNQGAQA